MDGCKRKLMRKGMLISILSLLSLSCVQKDSLLSRADSPERILFNPPLVGGNTKTIVKGTKYPTTESFTVWGFFSLHANDAPIPGPNGINYIDGAECVHEGTEPNDYWVPSYPDADGSGNPGYYYWKDGVGYMTFHALSPRSVVHTHDWQTGFSIGNYTVGTEDVMYSHYLQAQRSDYNSSDPYDDSAGDTGPYKGVDISFHHALSVVKFGVKEAGDYAITVKKVELLSVYQTADFAENRASGALNTYSATPEWTPHTDSEHTYTLYEDNVGTPLTWVNDQGVVAPLEDELLVIPQNLDHSADGNGKVAVRLSFSRGGNDR